MSSPVQELISLLAKLEVKEQVKLTNKQLLASLTKELIELAYNLKTTISDDVIDDYDRLLNYDKASYKDNKGKEYYYYGSLPKALNHIGQKIAYWQELTSNDTDLKNYVNSNYEYDKEVDTKADFDKFIDDEIAYNKELLPLKIKHYKQILEHIGGL